jgi:hypothetical protein
MGSGSLSSREFTTFGPTDVNRRRRSTSRPTIDPQLRTNAGSNMLKHRIFPVLALVSCLVFAGCLTPPDDPAGIARSTRPLSAEQVAALPGGASLAELERIFGAGEEQPGPRMVYRAKDHPGKYYWVHSYRPAAPGSESRVHHIVLADRIEEDGRVVWPSKWEDLSPRSADYYLRQFESSGAQDAVR